jgi:hypothetical protein
MKEAPMSKYVVLAAVLLGSVTLAEAGKLKIKDFYPMNGASEDADGMAFFASDEMTGCTDAKIHVSDLCPNASYGVVGLGGVEFDIPPVTGIQTNASGNGHLSISCLSGQNIEVPVMVYVYEDTNNSGSYDEGEERLVGDSAP